jgi:[ribosomal protein S5]-alanine N-acetyltransferase
MTRAALADARRGAAPDSPVSPAEPPVTPAAAMTTGRPMTTDDPAAFAVHGRRISLRYPRPDDASALYELACDPDVTRYFSWGPYRAPSEAAAWLATLPARRSAGVALELAITDLADRPLGIILLSDFSARDRRAVVGTWVGRTHWGTGVNRDAKALIARLAFGTLGVERLGAYADVRNGRSQAALERVGFTREGVLKAFHRHHDGARDVATYAMLRNEWRVSRLARVTAVVSGDPPPEFIAGPRREAGDDPEPGAPRENRGARITERARREPGC